MQVRMSSEQQVVPTNFDLIKSLTAILEGQIETIAMQRRRIDVLERELALLKIQYNRIDRIMKEWMV